MSCVFSFVGEGFSGGCFERGTNGTVCYVVNVYSSCSLSGKRRLWQDLRRVRNSFGDGMWCLVGDYNAVCNTRERNGVGSSFGSQEAYEFSSFVGDMELIDLQLLGRRFTWQKADGSAMSRLDRFLLSEAWIEAWEVEAQWALNRDVSDHCPILLKQGAQDWGPKPFRFNNCWLGHPDFRKVVEKCWE